MEGQGRLTEPMTYDAASDTYVPISWADAFTLVGTHLRGLDSQHQASFYTSGRLSNEATFLYQLWVREFGTNNLPDCSNMCHEASGRAEFWASPLPDVLPPKGRLMLSTVRSHDQWNTTIYSDNDRYRGVKNLRTLLFMNEGDMVERGLKAFDLIDITSFARDGSTRTVWGYRAIAYDIPAGSVSGYMPELNVLCALSDFSTQSDQPLMKHQIVEVTPAADADITASRDVDVP